MDGAVTAARMRRRACASAGWRRGRGLWAGLGLGLGLGLGFWPPGARAETPPATPTTQVPLPPLPAGPGFARLPVPGFLPAVVSWPPSQAGEAAPGQGRPLPVVVAMHGSFDQPEWNCETYAQIVRGAAAVLCPRGRLRWDSPTEPAQLRFFFPSTGGWLGREVAAAVQALRASAPQRVAAGPVLYAGFSQGAILGAPLAIAHPALYPRLLLVEGGHGAWSPQSARAFRAGGGQRVLFACGRASCQQSARAAAAHLERAGVPVRVVLAPDQGHTYDGGVKDVVAAALAWLVEGDARFAPPAAAP